MKHHILVKWREPADRETLRREAEAVFADALSIPGVHDLTLLPNVVDRPNRYDLMIVLTMDPEALPRYDESEPHRRWKAEFGDRIAQKAIFDCD